MRRPVVPACPSMKTRRVMRASIAAGGLSARARRARRAELRSGRDLERARRARLGARGAAPRRRARRRALRAPVAGAQLGERALELAGGRVDAEAEQRGRAAVALDRELHVVRARRERERAAQLGAVGLAQLAGLGARAEVARDDAA